MASGINERNGRRIQYAALPYRVRRDGTVEVRLITSRETRRWVIPKGWPMKGLTPPKAAARETYEEAGLLGTVAREPLGLYTYDKRLATRSVPCDVIVFPLKVKRRVRNWPERSQRFGFWFPIESAAAAVQEEELKVLILAFGDLMAQKFAEKRSSAPAKPVSAAVGKAADVAPAPVPGDAPAVEGEAKAADKAATRSADKAAAKASAKRTTKAPAEVPSKVPSKVSRKERAAAPPDSGATADAAASQPAGSKKNGAAKGAKAKPAAERTQSKLPPSLP